MIFDNNRITLLFAKVVLVILILHPSDLLFAQSAMWEIDKEEIREQRRSQEYDSIIVSLKDRWQISLNFGHRYFNNSSITQAETLLDFPKNTSVWNLSLSKYISESIAVNANLGMSLNKIEPPRPNLSSVINGDDVEIEGGGVLILPAGIGIDYFFMKKRFRPYAGLDIGVVAGRFTYVNGSGNINNGFSRNELRVSSIAPFVELSSGFVYRTGKNIQLGLSCGYLHSYNFSKTIGTYDAYSGLSISAIWAVLF